MTTGGRRGFSRLDRVNEALREVLGEELERIDDARLDLVTVTGVKASPDLRHALVWYSSLAGGHDPGEVAEALAVHRVRLQAAVGRQLRLKRTPELAFQSDPAIAVGTRVEEIIREIRRQSDDPSSSDSQSSGNKASREGDGTT
jgi:ribosome-binding factor A